MQTRRSHYVYVIRIYDDFLGKIAARALFAKCHLKCIYSKIRGVIMSRYYLVEKLVTISIFIVHTRGICIESSKKVPRASCCHKNHNTLFQIIFKYGNTLGCLSTMGGFICFWLCWSGAIWFLMERALFKCCSLISRCSASPRMLGLLKEDLPTIAY